MEVGGGMPRVSVQAQYARRLGTVYRGARNLGMTVAAVAQALGTARGVIQVWRDAQSPPVRAVVIDSRFTPGVAHRSVMFRDTPLEDRCQVAFFFDGEDGWHVAAKSFTGDGARFLCELYRKGSTMYVMPDVQAPPGAGSLPPGDCILNRSYRDDPRSCERKDGRIARGR